MTPPPPAPAIDAMEPASGRPGSKVVLRGKNFSSRLAANTVTLGGRPAVVLSATPHALEVSVPSGASSGPFVVKIQPGGEAQQILSGQTRAVHGPGKTLAESGNQWDKVLEEIETGRIDAAYTSAPPDRAFPGTHRWMSDPVKGLPAWIELRWPGVVAVSEIQLIFDTGMDRFLTLSQADGYTRRMRWGVPQPETVRDYRIEVATDAGATWREVVAVTGNYQRRRVHRLEAAERVRAIRVQVMATNGLDHARIFEVRAYGPTVEDR